MEKQLFDNETRYSNLDSELLDGKQSVGWIHVIRLRDLQPREGLRSPDVRIAPIEIETAARKRADLRSLAARRAEVTLSTWPAGLTWECVVSAPDAIEGRSPVVEQ